MINVNEALMAIKKKFPNGDVTGAWDLNSQYWLFSVAEKSKKGTRYNPFHAVNKKTGECVNYSPMFDMDEFNRAKKVQV